MSDDEKISHLREAEGRKARAAGEQLHEGASEEFSRGYTRTTVGFGSNITPRNFGRGGSASPDWLCVCGERNQGRIRYIVANREVCKSCKQERTYTDVERIGPVDDGEEGTDAT